MRHQEGFRVCRVMDFQVEQVSPVVVRLRSGFLCRVFVSGGGERAAASDLAATSVSVVALVAEVNSCG